MVAGLDTEWRSEVVARCVTCVHELLGERRTIDVMAEFPAEGFLAPGSPQAVFLYLADEKSLVDTRIHEQIALAQKQFIPVLPVVHPGVDVFQILPAALRKLNAISWDRTGSQVVGAVLRLLGLIEDDRRLFLSYRRQESSELALQLREHLSRRSYDVFLDRFSVPPAADFQRRIDVELADKAFVLLLESRAAIGSPWVQHEVTYALSHGISLLALTLPETAQEHRFPSVDESFRLHVSANQLQGHGGIERVDREFTQGSLDLILDRIEEIYAIELRRRRAALMGSLWVWLEAAGYSCAITSDEWSLAATRRERAVVFRITPRAAQPMDMRRLDDIRVQLERQIAAPVVGCLVPAAAVQDGMEASLIEWIAQDCPLLVVPHMRIPSFLER